MVLYNYHFIIFRDRGAFFISSVRGRPAAAAWTGRKRGKCRRQGRAVFAAPGRMVKSHRSVTACVVERYLQYVGMVYVLDVAAALCAGAIYFCIF